MKEEIIKKLKELEKREGIEIILAVESGSRAWGFAGKDADYDIRFVFKRRLKDYLRINKLPRDYEWTDGLLDFQGMDIFKFFELVNDSNMNMIDWLQETGDMVYINKIKDKEKILEIIKKYFSRRTYIAHNYGLCKKNYYKYFIKHGDFEPTAKRFVYCLRALFSVEYCERFDTIAPINFDELVKRLNLKKEEQEELDRLMEIKRLGERIAYKNQFWNDYIKEKMETYKSGCSEGNKKELEAELNVFLCSEVMNGECLLLLK